MELNENISHEVMNAPALNLMIVAGLVVFVFFALFIFTKKGVLAVRGKNIRVGMSEGGTRELIRKQFDYATNIIREFVLMMDIDTDDEKTAEIASEKVLDEIMRWIVLNNIEDSPMYINDKQIAVWNIIQNEVRSDYFKSREFRDKCDDKVSEVIKNLVEKKQYYEGRGL